MIYNTETTINGSIINIDVDYDFFREDGEVTININSITNDGVDIDTLDIPNSDMETIRTNCADHYENYKFRQIEALMNKKWYGMDNSKEEL